jgi:hypothetical protein
MSRAPGARYEILGNSHSSKSAIALYICTLCTILYTWRSTSLAELCSDSFLSPVCCVFSLLLSPLPLFYSESISNSVAVVARSF